MEQDRQDLFSPTDKTTMERRIYTVYELTKDIKLLLESAFGQVWIEAEVSNLQQSSLRHMYFTLKDDQALLNAAIFNFADKDIKFKIENGLKVICYGRIDLWPPRGQYKLIIEKMEPKGIGSLQLELEQLKKKLEKEGLFSSARKRPLPYLPSRIGVVTSLDGAAIKDILKVLERRFNDVSIVINPVQVQGGAAKEDIARAIKDMNRYNQTLPACEQIEVMIVGRGGGSIEDLWAFNEEVVARAIFNSAIPVISAVGHERDVTIADLVADVRAATPSVAAELVVPKKEDVNGQLRDTISKLKNSFSDALLNLGQDLDGLKHRLKLRNPAVLLEENKLKITGLARQISVRIQHLFKLKDAEFKNAAERLDGLSPLSILSRGYSVTFTIPQQEIIKEARRLSRGDMIKTMFYNGGITSKVTEVYKHGGNQV